MMTARTSGRKGAPVFRSKPKKDLNLTRIIAVIVVIAAVIFGIQQLYAWFTSRPEGVLGAGSAPSGTVEDAKKLLAEGKAADAKAMLDPLVGDKKRRSDSLDVLMLLAEAEQKLGNMDRALELMRRSAEEFPASPDQPKAALAYARLLEEAGKPDEAIPIYEKVRNDSPPAMRAPALTGLGRKSERANDRKAARDLFTQAVKEAEWNSDAWNEALDALGKINVTMIFSPEELPESKWYTVAKGDNFTGIGIKLNTTMGLLTRANGLEENARLQLGQRLKYTPKDFRIVAERSTCRLFLLDKDGIFKRYFVGFGKAGHETALGSYKIGNKEKDPVWHKPGEGPIPAGDPRNQLGTRWMPLIPLENGLPTDLGIHGTLQPETIGTYSSNGCIRLQKDDIEELYDLVVRSTPVRIVETFTPQDVAPPPEPAPPVDNPPKPAQ